MTLFVLVCVNWVTNGSWQTKLLDTKKVTQLNLLLSHSKALFEIFYSLLTAPRTVSNTYAQVARVQSCANHVQHIERLSHASVMLRATWYEGTTQLLSLTELKSHLFELYCIG